MSKLIIHPLLNADCYIFLHLIDILHVPWLYPSGPVYRILLNEFSKLFQHFSAFNLFISLLFLFLFAPFWSWWKNGESGGGGVYHFYLFFVILEFYSPNVSLNSLRPLLIFMSTANKLNSLNLPESELKNSWFMAF